MAKIGPTDEGDSSDLLFSGSPEQATTGDQARQGTRAESARPWKIMVIDDDDVVHQVTLMVLADYTFQGRPVEVIQGYSGGACRNLLRKHPDTAVLLLDVVMETDTAGLDTVKYIREDLDNQAVRIILRTGQPGQAPKREVIAKYDINDYKEKSELTVQKLYNAISASLQAYSELGH